MRSILFKISVVFSALLLLIATMGVNIYSHDCTCCASSQIAIMEVPDECCEDVAASETYNQADACTCHITNSHQAGHKCHFNHQYHKLVVNFTSPVIAQLMPLMLSLNEIILHEQQPIVVEDTTKNTLQLLQHLPPKLAHRAFIIFTHTLKIPF
ncbi:MAG: hypothetical protein EOM83_11920 [Clostridia bacterium]|nr:hypothetical protein [Clostridia bacterium]